MLPSPPWKLTSGWLVIACRKQQPRSRTSVPEGAFAVRKRVGVTPRDRSPLISSSPQRLIGGHYGVCGHPGATWRHSFAASPRGGGHLHGPTAQRGGDRRPG